MRMQKGFTLIELIVAFGLFSVLIMATTLMLASVLRATAKTAAQTQVQNEGTFMMDSIYQQVRYAQSVSCDPTSNNAYVNINPVTGTALSFNCDNANSLLGKNGTGWPNAINSTKVLVTQCSFVCTKSGDEVTNVEVTFSVQDQYRIVPAVIYDSNISLRNI